MGFIFLDIFLAIVTFLLVIALSLFSTIILSMFPFMAGEFSAIFKILFFILSLMVWSGLSMKAIRVFSPLKEGIFLMDKDKEAIAWRLQGFLYIFNLGLVMNTYLVPVNLRRFVYSFLGAEIGRNVMIGGKILEPPLIEIGDYTMLGEDTLIIAHSVEGNKLELGKVRIGKHVTIGVKAVVLPDVEIGDHSIVAAGAVVTKGTRILPNEIWSGVPAKKIGEVALPQ